MFRKLKRVKEVYKECKLQDIFDVILTAAIHHVFKQDLPSLEIAFNHSEVHLKLHAVYLTVAFRLAPPLSAVYLINAPEVYFLS